jgi:peptidoglycan/LPS O-acetylase OafA/YrhL
MAEEAAKPDQAVAPPPGNPRFPLFDGLRAIAALLVVLVHAARFSGAIVGSSGLAPFLAHANIGVAIFFVISGFLLYRPLLAARLGAAPGVRVRDYTRRRVLRIVPAYWVALTVLAIYPGLDDVFSGHFWIYYGFAQDYSQSTWTNGIPAAWTLGCEAVFYVLLPFLSLLLMWGARALTRRGVCWQLELGVLGALSIASAHYRLASLGASFAANFAWFAAGMVLALASALHGERLAGTARWWSWGGWIAALLAFVVMCKGLGLSPDPYTERDTAAQVLAIYGLSAVVALGLAMPAVCERRPLTAPGRLLAARPLAWLGLVSYGIYLYHQPLMRWLHARASIHGRPLLNCVWLASAGLLLALSAAALSYYLIERPVLRMKEPRRAADSGYAYVTDAEPGPVP